MDKVTLYGLNKAGGFKIWTIETDEQGLITIQHGKEGGKLQTKSELVKGKNIGRANETTPAEQAESEAKGTIKVQRDKGYRDNKLELSDIPVIAMLAVDYHKQGHRLEFPCFGSVKFDGVRALAKKKNGVVTLESRTGQLYDLPILSEQLSALMDDDDTLDGEVYLHGYDLQDIVSAVKRTDTQKALDKAQAKVDKFDTVVSTEEWDKWQAVDAELQEAKLIHEIRPLLQYHVFDIVELDVPFETRLEWLGEYMVRFSDNPLIKEVEYTEIKDKEELVQAHADAVAAAFEGLMLRNRKGLYQSGKRSADLQKYKAFLDSEFTILDVIEDKEGLAVFVVQNTFNSNTFNVIMGSKEQKARYLEEKEQLIGKPLTVQYQTLYKGTKKPQFPTGVVIRDYE